MFYENKKFRHELKFYINTHTFIVLRNRLKAVMKKDINSVNSEGYHIRSLYFDDIYNSAFRQKVSGIDKRKKYRIRIYNHSDKLIKLEKKIKSVSYISKTSISITREEFYSILDKNVQFLMESDNKLKHEFYVCMVKDFLKPVITVDYIREAYTFDVDNIRITFDKKLEAGINSFDIFGNNIITSSCIDMGTVIMEIKYNRPIPHFIRKLLQIGSFEYCSISKYVLCREKQNTIQWGDVI
jgi:hypothetical protein